MKRYFSYFVLALLVALTCVQAVDAAIQAGPIKIGVVMPTTGPIAYDGRLTLNGIEMAVEEINKAGGIKGNKVELFI